MKKTSIIPSLFVFLFGSAMSGLVLFFLLERDNSRIGMETFKGSEELRSSIQEQILISKNFIRGIESMFYSSDLVTRKEFNSFCKNYIVGESAIKLVEWQPRVLSSQRDAFEKSARRDGLKGFYFFEVDENGKQIPALERKEHYPVFYSYSPVDDIDTIGLDLAFSPLRMKSKFEAMRLGGSVASETFGVILKGVKERRLGMAFSHAIFNEGSIRSSETTDSLKGFLAVVIDLEKVFTLVSESNPLSNFQYVVKDEGDEHKVIFSTLEDGLYLQDYAKYQSLDLGGRTWGVYVYPTKRFFRSRRSLTPWVIFVLLILINFGLAAYLYLKSLSEDKIRSFERQLEQKQRLESIGLLASGVAHEFNNVLQGILLASENLRETIGKDSSQNECLDINEELCLRGRDLVRQILSFARREAEVEKEIMPSLAIRSTINFLRKSFGSGIDFKLNIDEKLDRPIFLGVHHLTQILVNLCSNAAQAIEDKGVIEITYQVFPDYRLLSVKDNGMGMSEENLKKVFDPFFTTKSGNEGTGLGLSIIYGIVKSYNGEIKVKSTVGLGSEFIIRIPDNKK